MFKSIGKRIAMTAIAVFSFLLLVFCRILWQFRGLKTTQIYLR